MADDNQKSRNILENSNFLKHRCCLEDRAFLSNSIELVQRENFLALLFLQTLQINNLCVGKASFNKTKSGPG